MSGSSDPDWDSSSDSNTTRSSSRSRQQYSNSDSTEEDTIDGALNVGRGDDCIVFTRYLYNKVEVKQSLFFSILDKQGYESMFWAYELYYSGFHVELLEYLLNIYKEVYYETNKKLSYFINNTLNEWSDYPERVWLLGSIVMTLSQRDYDINPFITNYFKIKCHPKPRSESSLHKMIIRIKDDDIVSFKTLNVPDAENVMKYVCRFRLRKEVSALFDVDIPHYKTMLDYFEFNWLYYGYRSPIWRERIDDYGGILNHEKKEVVFEDEDAFEDFYQRWGYNPQEQSHDVRWNCIGNGQEDQMTLKEFCRRFGATPVMKKVKPEIQSDSNGTTLANTITYT